MGISVSYPIVVQWGEGALPDKFLGANLTVRDRLPEATGRSVGRSYAYSCAELG